MPLRTDHTAMPPDTSGNQSKARRCRHSFALRRMFASGAWRRVDERNKPPCSLMRKRLERRSSRGPVDFTKGREPPCSRHQEIYDRRPILWAASTRPSGSNSMFHRTQAFYHKSEGKDKRNNALLQIWLALLRNHGTEHCQGLRLRMALCLPGSLAMRGGRVRDARPGSATGQID
jgi:hypothetical protein